MPDKNIPKNWTPPYPSHMAEFAEPVTEIVVAYLAAQLRSGSAAEFHDWMRGSLAAPHAPGHVERASFIDASSCRNEVYICYWTDEEEYQSWAHSPAFTGWWDARARLAESVGYWREVIVAPLRRLETLFSSQDAAGMARLAPQFSNEVREHGYWGSMRDRIPDAGVDGLTSAFGAALVALDKVDSMGKRLSVTPPENICLIRSAQNWSDCRGEELAIYRDNVLPVLLAGMNFIRDNPIETGCISCRFMDEQNADGGVQSRSFGMAWFLTLGHLEAWAKSHPTHLAIFRSFHEMVRKLNFQLDLKLWHEVIVLPAGSHVFEYVNCHPGTGLLPYFEPG